jgi:hypothetical protein
MHIQLYPSLSLPLLMPLVTADDPYNSLSLYKLTFYTYGFYRSPDLHDITSL